MRNGARKAGGGSDGGAGEEMQTGTGRGGDARIGRSRDEEDRQQAADEAAGRCEGRPWMGGQMMATSVNMEGWMKHGP